ncbi:MAG: rhomboid family intramembrane serine protease [Gemmatimonadota bacterium]
MIDSSERRITYWVGRLLAVNAFVLLAQETVFTSSALADAVSFSSSLALQRPWTFVTYMFVHGGIWHLAANSLALFVFGPAVERRLGGRAFLVYYFLCGIGAALFSMILHVFNLGAEPFVGASGAIIGVAFAFAKFQPDAQLMIFPLPVPVKARYMIMLLAAFDVTGLLLLNDGIAHGAHLGGLLTGVMYFVLRSLGRPADTIPLPSIRRRVPVATRTVGAAGGQPLSTSRPDAVAADPSPEDRRGATETVELDRVLDKISASGIGSLTTDERRFLDAMARRRRDLN